MNTTHRPAPGRSKQRGRRTGKRKELMSVPQVSAEAQAHLKTLLKDGSYIVFDIETTGGNPEKNGITEIFAIRYHRGEIGGTFYSMVNPGIPIPPIVRRMTGINNQMVRNAPRIAAVMPDFVKFIGNDVLVSHNTIGDMKFLRHFAKETTGVDLENFYLCTHLLVEKLAPETPDKSLRGLAAFFELASGELHRAEADAYVTLALFNVLLRRLEERSVRRIDEAVRLQGDLESGMRMGWGILPERLQNMPNGPGLIYLYDHEQKPLFIASALHLDREVAKLKVFHQLPRQLLRLLLKSADLEVKRTPNAYAAMLEEGRELAQHKGLLHPVNFHQRSVQALFLLSDAQGVRLDIGPLEEGTRLAFGLVRDRRVALEYLDDIAKAAGVKVGRHGLRLPLPYEEPLIALLTGRLPDALAKLQSQRRSPRLWFSPRGRQELSGKIALYQALAQVRTPLRLNTLLNCAGIIAVPEHKGVWQIHHIVGGRPTATSTISGDLDKELWQNGHAAQLAQTIAAGLASLAGKPLTHAEAHGVNATLWWIYNGKFEGRFYSLAQLQEKLEADAKAKPEA